MPASAHATRQTVHVPYSEAAMFSRVAGLTLEAIEEDIYVNGNPIPPLQRHGCYVITPTGARLPLGKSEAGWRSCTCPSDCGCHSEHKAAVCGCQGH